MKQKNRSAILEAFEDIFNQTGTVPEKLQGDSEFLHYKSWLEAKNIYVRFLYRRNKAVFAEYYIYTVKRRLYHFMAHNDTKDWWKILKQATQNVNDIEKPILGGLKASDITGPEDDTLIRKMNPERPMPLTIEERQANREKYYESEQKIHKGDLVLYDMDTPAQKKGKAFIKSYQEKVSFPYFNKKNTFERYKS